MKSGTREFSTSQIQAATRFIEGLPPGLKVYVDEWVQERWRIVLGETPKLALGGLERLTPGSKFRVRPVSILLG
jgi:hypothetical protein